MIFELTEKEVFTLKLKGVPVRLNALEYGQVGTYRYSRSFEALIRCDIIRHAPFAPDSDVYEVMYPLRILSVIPMKSKDGIKDYSFMHGQRYEIGDIVKVKDGSVWDSK